MWLYRRKSIKEDNSNDNDDNDSIFYDCNSPKTRSSPSFKRRSFKDIEILTNGDENISYMNTIEEQASSSSQNEVKRPSIFQRVHLATRFTRVFSAQSTPEPDSSQNSKVAGTEPPANMDKPEKLENSVKLYKSEPRITIPESDKRVVVYMTSLRAVRPTFEACRTVRSILQGFRVIVDERDLLMDSSFADEIRKIMVQIGQGGSDNKTVSLPKVFIGGRYIGGADEIVELHEIGELKKFVSGLPAVTPGVCEICGGFRFYLCNECNGSHKCPLEDGGFTTCTLCNENGLIRCTSCLSS